MAVLNETRRAKAFKRLMELISEHRGTIPVTRSELRAALDAADDWRDAQASSYNTALPQPARGACSTKIKVAALMCVLEEAYDVET